MDYNTLMDLVTDLGYELSMSGAETFRVEESIQRILSTYGVEAEVFAIPNNLIVSIITETGKPITRMRRIGYHGNNLDAVERLNALSRKICSLKPEPKDAALWLQDVTNSVPLYHPSWFYVGNFLGAFGFSALFGCSLRDMLCAGLCGLVIGFVNRFLGKMKTNQFFSTLSAAFIMAILAYDFKSIGLVQNTDAVIIGALMLLVPGLLFTNAMRDIIYGDTNSGINRIVQVLIIAVAIAIGTAAAWNLSSRYLHIPAVVSVQTQPLLVCCLCAAVGCIGFAILFNIHGPGGLLCALGGLIAWAIYDLTVRRGGGDLTGYFWASVFSSLYAEIMARIRKYPAISYLVVSIFPLIPGAGVYYAMTFAVDGNTEAFASQGLHTAAIAGTIAVGILLGSTIIRLITSHTSSHIKK